MNTLFIILLTAFYYLPAYFIFGFMPYMTRKTDSFGINIPEEKFSDQKTIELRKNYRNSVLIFGGLIIIIALVSDLLLPISILTVTIFAGIILLFAVVFIFYIIYHNKMKELKREKGTDINS